MKLIKVAAGVLNQTPLDWDGNRLHIEQAIAAARAQQVSLLCLPELCVSGYGCEDAFHSVGMQQESLRMLAEIADQTSDLIVSVGLPLYFQGGLYNTAALLANGQVHGFVAKKNLAGDGLHYEPRWFKPWPSRKVARYSWDGTDYPLGDLIFDCGGIRVGFEICEDAWVAHRPGGQLAAEGVDILLNPSASHFAFGKHRVRRRFVLDGSRAFSVVYVYTNLVGNEAGRAIYDGDAMIASCGQLLACGPRFSYRSCLVTTATVDFDRVRVNRARTSSYQPAIGDQPSVVRVPFEFPVQPVQAPATPQAEWETSAHVKEEEFARAVPLGLFDYMRKSRSRGFVVSLSGGADSSAVATLVACMVRLAVAELGVEGFRSKLFFFELPAGDERQIIPALLTCVYQSTRNSSATTRNAAAAVAHEVGATFLELDVDPLVQQYGTMVADSIDRPLSWERDDLALQNIQARVRGPSVWMLANLHGALLLATSNRSEAAVGYATMDGDTCGGLSPIAGIDKAFLRHWLSWMETEGPRGVGPFPSLAAVNRQAPTAELRPLESSQTDERDLMPYELLDAIERAAIRDKHTPLEVYLLMRSTFPQWSAQQLNLWIERFFRLWCRNQWKRERYAPSFHLDDENLDPKTWCRFPILSGGYERELRELRAYVEQSSSQNESSVSSSESTS